MLKFPVNVFHSPTVNQHKSEREREVTHETKTIQLRHRKHTETSRRGLKIRTDTGPKIRTDRLPKLQPPNHMTWSDSRQIPKNLK